MKCEHKWQCYGVDTVITDFDGGEQYKYHAVRHFRSCGLCGEVEELELKGGER